MVSNIQTICNKCIMDISDPNISFDDEGICNHCRSYDVMIKKNVLSGEAGKKKLTSIVNKIKADGINKEYDCIIGVSGGVDSSYVAYLTKKLHLRPLAVHLDNGWDTEISVRNIENLLDKLEIDLYTNVLDWDEFRDLQLAFLKASTPDSEIPSDHAIVASVYKKAKELGVRHIIMGYNTKTETHLPQSWSQGHFDWKYIKSIHSLFGTVPLRTFPHFTYFQWVRFQREFNRFLILNFVDYVKQDAIEILKDELNWTYYGGKHSESIYTRFYQGYILPRKFGFDKRKSHFSSLICSGEMRREDALAELKESPYPLEQIENDKKFVINKLDISEEEFEKIMNLSCKTFKDYPSYEKMLTPLTNSPIYPAIQFFYKVYTNQK